MWEAAHKYLTLAANKAAGRSAHQEAVTHLQQALAVVQRLPESRETCERAIDLRLALRTSLLPSADFELIEENLRAAGLVAEVLGDDRRLARVMVLLAQHFRLLARNVEALESGQRALEIGRKLDDRPIRVVASQYLSQTYFGLAEHRQALELSRSAITLLGSESLGERFGQAVLPGVFARTYAALSFAELGQFEQAHVWIDEAIHISEVSEQPVSLIHASWAHGRCLIEQGLLGDADREADRGLSLCRTWRVSYWVPLVSAVRGYLDALRDGVATGLPVLEEAVERTKKMKLIGDHFNGACYLGATYIMANRITDAAELTTRTLELSQLHGQRGDQARLLRLAGEAAFYADCRTPRQRCGTTGKRSI